MNLTLEVKDCIIDMLKNFKNEDCRSQNYRLVTKEPIARGGFGKVFEVVARQTSQSQHRLAMKKIEICFEENYSDEGISSTSASDEQNILDFVQCCQEAVLQSEVFDHPGIVKVHDKWIQKPSAHSKDPKLQTYAEDILIIAKFLQSGGQEAGVNVLEITPEVRQALVRTEGLCVYLIMEFYDSSLESWISTRREPQTKEEIIVQLIQALHYIHSEKGYCHLDLSPTNILVKEGENGISVAIGDFGLSLLYESSVPQRIDTRPGKPPYNTAPDEYLTYSYDMWSFGFIVYEILCTKAPYGTKLQELIDIAKKGRAALAEHLTTSPISECASKSIVARCLQLTNRVTAGELLTECTNSTLDIPGQHFEPNEDTMSVLSIVSSSSSLLLGIPTPIPLNEISMNLPEILQLHQDEPLPLLQSTEMAPQWDIEEMAPLQERDGNLPVGFIPRRWNLQARDARLSHQLQPEPATYSFAAYVVEEMDSSTELVEVTSKPPSKLRQFLGRLRDLFKLRQKPLSPLPVERNATSYEEVANCDSVSFIQRCTIEELAR